MTDVAAAPDGAPTIHAIEFRGRGAAYFRIWIVNLTLTLLTLGIYGAWAKVRTRRYFYGNTFVAGQSFEYRGAAWRIAAGRAIVAALAAAAVLSTLIAPFTLAAWLVVAAGVMPLLVRASLRFHARNTAWCHVRFGFEAGYRQAFLATVAWPVGALLLLPLPGAKRAWDYFYVDSRSLGGRALRTTYPARRIYAIYMFGFILLVALLLAVLGSAAGIVVAATRLHNVLGKFSIPLGPDHFSVMVTAAFGIGALFVVYLMMAMGRNLWIGHTVLDGGFALTSTASSPAVAWIALSNLVLSIVTLGLFYPFGRIRMARYRLNRCALVAAGDLEAFVVQAQGPLRAAGGIGL